VAEREELERDLAEKEKQQTENGWRWMKTSDCAIWIKEG